MIIHVYAICWNEEKILPFFIRHYSSIAEKIIIYDNESSDRSREIIESSPKCIYRSYNSNNTIRDDLYASIKNNVWKESRGIADWVIVVDIDEFVYCPTDFFKEIKRLNKIGLSIITPTGYNMIADNIVWDSEKQLHELCKYGSLWIPESKPCVFNPNSVREINYNYGGHKCRPKNLWQKYKNRYLTRIIKNNLFVLHYKYLGLQYTVDRYKSLRSRLSDYNKSVAAGVHYLKSDEKVVEEFNRIKSEAKQIID